MTTRLGAARRHGGIVSALTRAAVIMLALFGTIVPTSSASIASPVRELPVEDGVVCQQCYYGWFATWSVPDQAWILTQGHVLYGDCSGGGSEVLHEGAPRNASILHAAAMDPGDGDEEESRCSRCGGPSSCHSYPQPGGCHVKCGGGIQRQLAVLEAVNTLIGKRDVGGLRELVSRDAKLEYNAERGIVQVLGCSQQVVAQLAVPTVLQLTMNGL